MEMETVVLLNALITSSRMPMTLKTQPVGLGDVRKIVEKKVVASYIGHEATAALLTQLLSVSVPTNRAMYDPMPGDKAIVVRMRKRLEKPEDLKEIREGDIEFLFVEYLNY